MRACRNRLAGAVVALLLALTTDLDGYPNISDYSPLVRR